MNREELCNTLAALSLQEENVVKQLWCIHSKMTTADKRKKLREMADYYSQPHTNATCLRTIMKDIYQQLDNVHDMPSYDWWVQSIIKSQVAA